MVAKTDADTWPEPISLPEFEDRLWEELARMHAEVVPGASTGRSRARRRLLAAAAAVVAVAGVAAVTAVDWRSGEPTDVAVSAPEEGGAGSGAGGPAGEDGPDPATPPDAVVVVEQVNEDGRTTRSWLDEATGAFRDRLVDAGGDPVSESTWTDVSRNEDGTVTVHSLQVDHVTGTYSEGEWTPGMEVDAGWEGDLGRNGAESNRRAVERGDRVEDGLEVVDGRELLRLVDTGGGQACATGDGGQEVCVDRAALELEADEEICPGDVVTAGGQDGPVVLTPGSGVPTVGGPTTSAPISLPPTTSGGGPGGSGAASSPDPGDCVVAGDLVPQDPVPDPSLGVTWVDPETYRSVKRVAYPGSDAGYTMTFEYLERTPENLALVDVDLPEGYTEVRPDGS